MTADERNLKLILADIAEERGDGLKAKFIRLQCQIPRVYDPEFETTYIKDILKCPFPFTVKKQEFDKLKMPNLVLYDQAILRKAKVKCQDFINNLSWLKEADKIWITDKVPTVQYGPPAWLRDTGWTTLYYSIPLVLWNKLKSNVQSDLVTYKAYVWHYQAINDLNRAALELANE